MLSADLVHRFYVKNGSKYSERHFFIKRVFYGGLKWNFPDLDLALAVAPLRGQRQNPSLLGQLIGISPPVVGLSANRIGFIEWNFVNVFRRFAS